MSLDKDHKSLQRKVQFDIRFFFVRRGSENMELMQRDDFKICFDTKSDTYFIKKIKDEMTKNHKDPENIITGYMPENKDDPSAQVILSKCTWNTWNQVTTFCGKHLCANSTHQEKFGTASNTWGKTPCQHL